MINKLKAKINSKTALIAVVGLGYVGLPLAVEKGKVGFTVVGIDQNEKRVDMVNQGHNYIKDVKDEDLQLLVQSGRLSATSSFSDLKEADIIIICVPTPLTKNKTPDISYIENVTDEIKKYLRPGQLVSLESTTYPGTTEEVILPRLEESGLKVGQDFFLAHSPERVDPGNKRFTTNNISKVVGGVTPACLEAAYTFYSQTIQHVYKVSSPAVAEITKVFENTYRAVNIALVNELMMLCDKMNLDVWEVVEAAGTKPFGIQTFYPGPGVGGHCIPIDPFYLAWKAREYDFNTRFIELAGEVNIMATYYTVDKIVEVLNANNKSVKGARVLILGVAYKKDIEDERESPALKIIHRLQQLGAYVLYHDPYIPLLKAHEPLEKDMHGVELTREIVESSDCVAIITDHTNIDYEWVVQHARLVVDARNATKNITVGKNKIIKI
ncbi:nucleotide sugar dehydrogenase [Thermanaerosceptrum fracticalcis]|uniref:Nucleotide sugar dehydrogenase n=1 Tax=Thermanaerosceptrum fracticalcis TaxID=1712410 RepID=A0A7G6E4L4_THEFR|nr:nucleotide sugar dehydrogenase [Thermanaerosceptrum fracticalcis]QNB47018.1 nucleotide sugar dehydrogenase [Thermanaerosceptrum fracticalcis]